jgi:glutathionylspermidine synthase
LVEAAVAQWYWLEEVFPEADQFNSIHEKLIRGWKKLARSADRVYLGGLRGHQEDEQTVLYIQDTCHQAGLETRHLFIDDVGFHDMRRRFTDLDGEGVKSYFKLFPWEWMWSSEYAPHLKLEVCQFIEPMWKMALSNKGLLPILWKLFPEHPNLLAAAFKPEELRARDYVKKPKLSREGANIAIVREGVVASETPGEYGEEGSIYQALAPTEVAPGAYAVFGVWIVDHEACGLGIREDRSPITGNMSRFIPHLFR